MSFDDPIVRTNTHCMKWDAVHARYDVPENCLPMWVADTDFRAPEVVIEAARRMVDHGVFGYAEGTRHYHTAVAWWMDTRHGWQIDPDWVFSTAGLVNAIGILMDTYTAPGDGIVIFPPVYHAFSRVISGAERQVVNCPLTRDGDRYIMDFDAADAAMTGSEKMLILCSPHNPCGRVWTRTELESVAAFAQRHDLIIVSDEIHHDLVYDGHTHVPMAHIDGIEDRLVMLTATSKTFNIAGLHVGNVIIPDDALRARFAARMTALAIATNSVGIEMATAAYSPEGAAWLDELIVYLDGNRKLFDAGIESIPGLHSIPLEATYLAWVDFSGTGMAKSEFIARIEKEAGIAANHGDTFGPGGDMFLRFNLGTQRARVAEAVERLRSAFSDLQ